MADVQAYRSWAQQMKAAGGVVTVFPSGPSRGLPAARFAKPLVAQLQAAKKLGVPGTWSADGAWGYYLAPVAVAKAAEGLSQATKEEIARASETLRRGWFGDFGFELGGTLKKALVIGGIVGGVALLAPPLFREYLASRRSL